MGNVCAMASIDRVLLKHASEIAEPYEEAAKLISGFQSVVLANEVDHIHVLYVFSVDGDDLVLDGPSIGIDELAETYPDCNVSY